ncbi:type II secretion system F family protein [Kitasatospora sp. NPDC004240]
MNLNPTAIVAALAGAVAVGGLCLTVAGVVGTSAPAPARPAGRLERKFRAGGLSGAGPSSGLANQRTLALAAVVIALIVWLFTSWLMGGLLTGLAVFGLPWILQPGRGSKAQIRRLEALEEWVRRLSDIHTAGISLEQAVASSVRSAPKLITPEVTRLASRLAAGWRAEIAYRAFADEMNDAAADSVAAPLILHVKDRGAGLSNALKALSAQVGEEVLMRRKVEAEREKPRTNMRWVSLFCLAVFALAMLSGAYVEPYSSLTGQIVLTLLAAGFIGVMVWMRRMAIAEPAPRFLAPATDRPDAGEAP